MGSPHASDIGLAIGRLLAIMCVLWLLSRSLRPVVQLLRGKNRVASKSNSSSQHNPKRSFWDFPSYTFPFYPPIEVELRRQAIRMRNKRKREADSARG